MSVRIWVPVLFIGILMLHGRTLGLSDDEAYYWVLAQKPSLGYAFHPPAVAWLIALFQYLLGKIAGLDSPALVRLPAVLLTAGVLGLSLDWLSQFQKNLGRASLVLLSFCGYFALSWMMVPDISLFFGWTLLFVSVWRVCFLKPSTYSFLWLTVGTATLLLSKYSGILGLFSAGVCLALWAPAGSRRKSFAALVTGTVVGALPILLWNAEHEWGSILYQVRDRHGAGEISWLRYGRFWAAQLLLAGPILVVFTLNLLRVSLRHGLHSWLSKRWQKRGGAGNSEILKRVWAFCAIWALPAATVFCVQPLFSEFKLHWAFVVWWPGVLALAASVSPRSWRWIRVQAISGGSLGLLILICCHLPVGGWVLRHLEGSAFDPRLDVTNDFYGWNLLREKIANLPPGTNQLEVVGARYQTASQAAFSLAGRNRVTLLPRDAKEMDEWPDLQVSSGQGPAWPLLKKSILFVADNRYDAPPAFPHASCLKMDRVEVRRFDLAAKRIDIWRCDP